MSSRKCEQVHLPSKKTKRFQNNDIKHILKNNQQTHNLNIGGLFWKKGTKNNQVCFPWTSWNQNKQNKKRRLKKYGKQIRLYNGWWEQQQNQASLTNVFSNRDNIECCSYE